MLRSVTKLSLAIFDDSRGAMRIIGLCVVMTGANLLAWTWVFLAFHSRLLLFGTALIACCFGLRHAVDADHVAVSGNAKEWNGMTVFYTSYDAPVGGREGQLGGMKSGSRGEG